MRRIGTFASVGRSRLRQLLTLTLAILAATIASWIWTTGPGTAYRIIVLNASSIDDHALFPFRVMERARRPFAFTLASPGRVPPRVERLLETIRENDTLALLAIHDDSIVIERYYADGGRARPFLSFSLAKSFLGTLVGIAIEDALFTSPDDSITRYIPELRRDPGFDRVTLHHLLQMTSGIAYTESDWPWALHPRFYYTDVLEAEALKLRVAQPPGKFTYRTSDTVLLTLALTRALASRGAGPRTVADYMHQRLWEPLGMEHAGFWSIDHAPDGLEKTGCCLRATARDVAKLGRLYLRGGDWDGSRVLSEQWVADTARPERDRGGSWRYQNHWWRVSPQGGVIVARGHLGQFLYVDIGRGIILVRMGRSLGDLDAEQWSSLLGEFAAMLGDWRRDEVTH